MPKVGIRCTPSGLEVVLELDVPREAVVVDVSSNELRSNTGRGGFEV